MKKADTTNEYMILCEENEMTQFCVDISASMPSCDTVVSLN